MYFLRIHFAFDVSKVTKSSVKYGVRSQKTVLDARVWCKRALDLCLPTQLKVNLSQSHNWNILRLGVIKHIFIKCLFKISLALCTIRFPWRSVFWVAAHTSCLPDGEDVAPGKRYNQTWDMNYYSLISLWTQINLQQNSDYVHWQITVSISSKNNDYWHFCSILSTSVIHISLLKTKGSMIFASVTNAPLLIPQSNWMSNFSLGLNSISFPKPIKYKTLSEPNPIP